MPTIRRYRTRRALLAALLALGISTIPVAAWAEGETDESNLTQTVDPDQAVATGQRVLDSGHVDLGPKFIDGTWRLMIHDDAAKADADATSVWRYPAQTVLHVFDEAKLTVPDDPDYRFIGAKAGASVWVVPQTQNPEVVWLGWNTQDPTVMKSIDRGITLSLVGVEGPGVVTTYLQSGSFGKPQVLFSSQTASTQSAWVDVNTHTHANWVFTKPGVYLIRLKASADLIDGTSVSDTQIIRIAVGTATNPADAMSSTQSPAEAANTETPTPEAVPATSGEEDDPLVPILLAAIVVVSAGLIGGLIMVVRGNRAKKAAFARSGEAAAAPSDQESAS